MFCYIFLKTLLLLLLLLLLLVVCCTSCGHAHTTTTTTITTSSTFSQLPTNSPAEKIDEFFKPGDILELLKPNGDDKKLKAEEFTVKNVKSVFIVATDDMMVALAEVNNSKKENSGGETKMDVLAKYINTKEGNNWGDDAVKSNNGKWKTQMVTENKKKHENGKVVVKSSAVTVKDNKIYYIAVSNDTFKDNGAPSEPSANEKWYAQLVVGKVNNGGKMTITWSTKESSELVQREELKEKLNTKPNSIPPSDGVVFAIENEKILFIMKGKAKAESDNGEKNVTAIFQLKDNGENENKLELLHVESHENCYPSFFKWEGKIIMAPTFCPPDVKKQMKVFDVTGKAFTASNMSIDRLQDFLEDKTNFVTAIIGGEKVLLLTQIKDPIWTKDVHLWITDGTRARDVGSIINENEGTFYGSVIYTNDELFALHQKYKNGEANRRQKDKDKFSLTRLKGLLGNIMSTLQAWNRSNKIIPTLCSTIGGQTTPCANQLPTDGLVGFLHNTSEGKEKWKDEYFYTNATVTNGKKVDFGFKFKGNGAGAKWLVGKTKEEQQYNFTDPGFTLVANVTIDSVVVTGDKGNSVLGVGYKESTGNEEKTIGLWCTSESEWELTGNEGSAKITVTNGTKCQQGSTYLVALMLRKSAFSAYIDGEQLGEGGSEKIKIETTHNITHFYFGAESNAESYVTVTNVLLYNRPLPEDVIKQLKIIKKKKTNDKEQDTEIQNGSDDVNIQKNKETARGSTDGKKGTVGQFNNCDEEILSSTPEDSTVRGGVVGVLLFMLLLNACMCVNVISG